MDLDFLTHAPFWIALGQIIIIDILLGGDNAVVIALACRKLPAAQRTKGIIWGTAGAIILRVVLIIFAMTLLNLPFLKVVGAILLVWIGVKLLAPDEDGHGILWYSMAARTLPSSITLEAVETLAASDEATNFIRAEYEVVLAETTQRWIVYFMDTNGIYSSYSIRVNESYENVRDTTDTMVKSYRAKTEQPA